MNEKYKPIKERSKQFSIEIIKYCLNLKSIGVEYPLRDQLLRSGTSIGANINEAQASSSRLQLHRYYEIALRSCDETKYWLEIIESAYQLKKADNLKNELDQLTRILASSILKLKNNPQSNTST